MSYVILGRAIKNEYITLGVLGSVFGGAFLATRMRKKNSSVNTSQKPRRRLVQDIIEPRVPKDNIPVDIRRDWTKALHSSLKFTLSDGGKLLKDGL
ncbi:hypothetical protein C8R41DRAFT_318578 [Lentinula lateritia]|uniref:Uncharacterized protein n=1 Tax=Lentinula lateritia TaxID=40482 RepID=A0ABQ8VH83_9AGAR|nr:hypothetical protein C8R41DRAFT_318578 [Lentinula lateritia]